MTCVPGALETRNFPKMCSDNFHEKCKRLLWFLCNLEKIDGGDNLPPPQKKKLGSMSKLAPKTSFYLKSQQFKSIMDLFYLITSFSNIFHPVDINL